MFAGYKPEEFQLDIGEPRRRETYGISPGFAMLATAPTIVALFWVVRWKEAYRFLHRSYKSLSVRLTTSCSLPRFMGVR